MRTRFHSRIEAGELLAQALKHYANRPDVLVLGLPRGGVPVGFAVAQRLRAPLDVLVVRKLGVPQQEELAMGAIASGGVRIMNDYVVEPLHIPRSAIDAVIQREQDELLRCERSYRANRPAPVVSDRTVILVDDGIATGASMRAAIRALRAQHARRIVAAAPVIAASTYEELQGEADEIVAVLTPTEFFSVGQWFRDFAPVTDAQVQVLLATAANPQPIA